MVVKGPGLTGNISGTDPLKDNRLLQVVAALDESAESKHTAAVVNELSTEMRRILSSHPLNAQRKAEGKTVANVVLLRGCGIRIEVWIFSQLSFFFTSSATRNLSILPEIVREFRDIPQSEPECSSIPVPRCLQLFKEIAETN